MKTTRILLLLALWAAAAQAQLPTKQVLTLDAAKKVAAAAEAEAKKRGATVVIAVVDELAVTQYAYCGGRREIKPDQAGPRRPAATEESAHVHSRLADSQGVNRAIEGRVPCQKVATGCVQPSDKVAALTIDFGKVSAGVYDIPAYSQGVDTIIGIGVPGAGSAGACVESCDVVANSPADVGKTTSYVDSIAAHGQGVDTTRADIHAGIGVPGGSSAGACV